MTTIKKIKKKLKKKKNNMKKLKKFESYVDDAIDAGLYDDMNDILTRANIVICKHNNLNPDEYNEAEDVESAIDGLLEIGSEEAHDLIDEIKSKENEIDEIESESYYNEDDEEDIIIESVGDPEESFVDVNLDETEFEDSDRPNLSKLKQKDGTVIIETPSKTDAYNAKMRLGGEIIVDPKSPEKQFHHVKKFNDFK